MFRERLNGKSQFDVHAPDVTVYWARRQIGVKPF